MRERSEGRARNRPGTSRSPPPHHMDELSVEVEVRELGSGLCFHCAAWAAGRALADVSVASPLVWLDSCPVSHFSCERYQLPGPTKLCA